MQFTITPMNEEAVRAISLWRYEGQYAVYYMDGDLEDTGIASEMLDHRSPYYAVSDEQGELVGFFNFGTSALPWGTDGPAIYTENKTVTLGLGMRPDLTGKGSGLAFVNAELDFAREHFAPDYFRLYVMSFNDRAIRVYEKAGFQRVRAFIQRNIHGENEFVEMTRKA